MPLHIFEERYRRLVRNCLGDASSFGIVLIKEGEEVGSHPITFSTGTEAKVITYAPFEEGRFNIVVRGLRRFEIQSLDRSDPLLFGEVAWLDEPRGDMEKLVGLTRLVMQLSTGLGLVVPIAHDDNSQPLSFRLADSLPMRQGSRQELLEAQGEMERLYMVAGLLMQLGQAIRPRGHS